MARMNYKWFFFPIRIHKFWKIFLSAVHCFERPSNLWTNRYSMLFVIFECLFMCDSVDFSLYPCAFVNSSMNDEHFKRLNIQSFNFYIKHVPALLTLIYGLFLTFSVFPVWFWLNLNFLNINYCRQFLIILIIFFSPGLMMLICN